MGNNENRARGFPFRQAAFESVVPLICEIAGRLHVPRIRTGYYYSRSFVQPVRAVSCRVDAREK